MFMVVVRSLNLRMSLKETVHSKVRDAGSVLCLNLGDEREGLAMLNWSRSVLHSIWYFKADQ